MPEDMLNLLRAAASLSSKERQFISRFLSNSLQMQKILEIASKLDPNERQLIEGYLAATQIHFNYILDINGINRMEMSLGPKDDDFCRCCGRQE